MRGLLLYGLIIVGVQGNYVATSPLRFEPDGTIGASDATSVVPDDTLRASPATSGRSATIADGALTTPEKLEAKLGASTTNSDDAPIPSAIAPPAPAGEGLPAELLPWRERLLRLTADERPRLEPELTLTELAQRLRTHPALLSKVINAGCGQNFNDFVSTYRVQEAQRKLADPRFGHYSLVGVALESGFNSKSTFNRVFRKLLGQAPSDVVRPKS